MRRLRQKEVPDGEIGMVFSVKTTPTQHSSIYAGSVANPAAGDDTDF